MGLSDAPTAGNLDFGFVAHIDVGAKIDGLRQSPWFFWFDEINQDDARLDQAVVDSALEAKFRGWVDELFTGRKFWQMDWNDLILGVLLERRYSTLSAARADSTSRR